MTQIPPSGEVPSNLPENPCDPMDGRRNILPGDSSLKQCNVRELTVQIQACESWDQLAELAVRGACGLVGAVDARWTEVSSDGRSSFWACSSSDEHAQHLTENLSRMLDRSQELGAFYQKLHVLMQGRSDEILMLGDYLSAEAMLENSYVCEFLTPRKVANIMSMQLFFSTGGSVLLCMSLPDNQISERQREDLQFLRQHIRLACAKLSRLASFTNLTDTLRQLWQQGGSVGISVLSKDGGKLGEMDDVSWSVIQDLGGGKDDEGNVYMPPELATWAQTVINEHTRVCAQTGEHTKEFFTDKGLRIQASLLLERSGSGALLIVKRDKKAGDFGGIFTRRELDVIHCINQGMTSQEVSEKLSISKRTVDKHLENIYSKLGVSNRISAIKRLESL